MSSNASRRGFILTQDTLIRKPLQDWAVELLSKLEASQPDDYQSQARLSACLNLAALIEVFRGERASAYSLCEAHLLWLSRLASVCDNKARVLALAFQPWVNIGRLHRLEANLDAALPHFSISPELGVGLPLMLGPCVVSAEMWTEMQGVEPSLSATLSRIQVVDSLKAFFRCGKYDWALDALAEVRSRPIRPDDDLLREAEVMVHMGLRRPERAFEVAAAYRGSSVLGNGVFMLDQAASLAELGRTRESEAMARELVDFVMLGGMDAFASSTVMQYASYLGGVLLALQDCERASLVYQKGYQIALEAGDEPYVVCFLDRLIESKPNASIGLLHEELGRILERCHYIDVRKGEISPPTEQAVFNELSKRLWELTS